MTETAQAIPIPQFAFIDSADALALAIARLADSPRVAIDTEADSFHHYQEKLCLAQISSETDHFVLDPLAGIDPQALFESFEGKTIVFHGGDYDLRLLRRFCDFRPAEIRDTGLAAQILGYEAFGLAALIKRHFDIDIPKASQRADWSLRPLTRDLLAYAIGDSCRLLPLLDILEQELLQAGRLEWFHQSCQRLLADTAVDREIDIEGLWRVKGWSKLSLRGQAILREIWRWRETEAERLDRPVFKVFSSQTMVELAEWADAHPGESIALFPHAPRNWHGRRLEYIERAVARALKMDESEWPEPLRARGARPDPAVEIRFRRIKNARNKIARDMGVDAGFLASNAALAAIAEADPRDRLALEAACTLLPWQLDAIEDAFLAALRGDAETECEGAEQKLESMTS